MIYLDGLMRRKIKLWLALPLLILLTIIAAYAISAKAAKTQAAINLQRTQAIVAQINANPQAYAQQFQRLRPVVSNSAPNRTAPVKTVTVASPIIQNDDSVTANLSQPAALVNQAVDLPAVAVNENETVSQPATESVVRIDEAQRTIVSPATDLPVEINNKVVIDKLELDNSLTAAAVSLPDGSAVASAISVSSGGFGAGGAGGGGGGPGFGGQILSATFCPCNFVWWLIIGPPTAGSYIYQPGTSQLLPEFQFAKPGAWVLGTAKGTMTCNHPIALCAPIGAGLLIEMMGTSP